jgi:putative MATE family efflux protein
VLNSRGQTGWVLVEAVVTTLSNLGINAWFHAVQWGDSGAARVAYATSFAQALGLLLTLYVVHRHLRIDVRWRAPLAELRERLTPVLRIGLPSTLEPVAYQGAQTCIMMMLVGMGARALAARVYVLNFFVMTTVLWCVGLGMGAQILVAHRVGARRFDDAHRVLRHALAVGATGCFALATMVWAGHEHLLRVFTEDPEILRIAEPLFLLGVGVETGRAFNVIAGGALRSTGDARFNALVGGGMMWLVGVPCAWLLGVRWGWGLTGIWVAMAVDELSRAGVNLLRWNSGVWRSKGIAH